MRRAVTLATTLLVLAGVPASAAAKAPPTLGTWNLGDQRTVARAGLLPELEDGELHGERAVAGTQARDALHALAPGLGLPPAANVPRGRLSVFAFDRLLVAQVGLADVAAAVQREARRAGLRPPAPFGSEVVARMLGLRHD